jgi:hypothetical protein
MPQLFFVVLQSLNVKLKNNGLNNQRKEKAGN